MRAQYQISKIESKSNKNKELSNARADDNFRKILASDSLLCRPTLAGLGPPRTVCLLWLAIRLPVVCH